MKPLSLLPTAALLAIAISQTTLAQSIWDGDTDTNWSNAANWSAGVPGGTTEAQFSSAFVNQPSLTVTVNVGSVRFNTATSVTIGSGGSFDLRTNAINVDQGLHTIARTRTRNNGDALTINTAATTQLTLNRIDVASGRIVKDGTGTVVLNTNSPVNPLGLVVNSGVLDTQVVYDMGAVGTTSSSNNRLISGTGGTITNTTLTNRSLVLGSREDATSYSATYQGNIAGTLSVVMGSADRKTNTYRQTFTGSNTYTQNTLVRAGTLIINGGHTGAGNYAVNGKTFDTVVGQEGAADGILGGNGAISLASASNTFRVENTSTTGSRGVLYPGGDNSDTGTLTVTLANTNGLTLGDNSVLRLDIGSGSASDKLAINGSFSLTGTSNTLDLLSLTGAWDGSTYTIVTWTGAFNGGTFDTISGLGSGYTVNYLANSITLSIPEPSTVLLLIGSLAAIGLTHRRFSRRQ